MAEPSTVNVGLITPNTGDLTGTWGSNALNPDFVALDGYLGGVQTISVSNAPITLTSPSGFTPTPGGGPTQAQNAVLSFTGALTANVTVTLPLPGIYQIENLTTGNFVLSFRAAGTGQVIGLDQGMSERVYCDGTNLRFAALGALGRVEVWAGLSAIPAWVTACTVPPFLLCDGAVYNFSTYPYLGKRLGGAFGGNGISTFGVPDLQGRVALPYDGTGTRITTSGSGINGQTIGASADNQDVTLTTSQMPSHNHGVTDNGHDHGFFVQTGTPNSGGGLAAVSGQFLQNTNNQTTQSSLTGIAIQNAGGGASHPNVQPSQVTGIAVIRAA